MAQLLGSVVAAALLGTFAGAPPVHAPTSQEVSATEPARHVVAISIDWLNPDVLDVLGREGTPALHRMIRQGVSTLEARTAYEQTRTMPNHTGMLTGRRVAGRKGHGVTFNHDPGGTVHRAAGRYVPSFFDVVHDHGRSTAMFASKDKFAFFDRTWGKHGAPDRVGEDDGRDKIDRFTYRQRPKALVDRILKRWDKRRPHAVTFLHIASPDVAGHEHGYGTPAYRAAVRQADRQVLRILRAVARSPRLAESVTVIVTADHGGNENGHFDAHQRGDFRVPFFAWGAGVARGQDLYTLNPERTHPGTTRPHYSDPPPIRNTDLAALVTTRLGLPAPRGSLLPGTTPLRLS